jgi:hypothetical protein
MKRKMVSVLFVAVVCFAISGTTFYKTAEFVPPEPLGIIANYK